MIIVIPYKTNMKGKHIPWMNYVFISFLIIVFIFVRRFATVEQVELFILQSWSIREILGYMWFHIGFIHLILNLIYLWFFGNALCSNMGNKLYFFYFLFGGIIAAIIHLLIDGRPVIGVSGSISAVIVALCMIFPYRRIRSTILFVVVPFYKFSLAGIWYLLVYFLYDLVKCLISGGKVAFATHIGGIFGGGALTYLLIKMGILNSEDTNEAVVHNIYSETG